MYLNVNKAYASFNSQLAKEEKNDCVVRSFAVATGSAYETAHEYCKEVFGRTDKKGTPNMNIVAQMLNLESTGIELNGKKLEVKVLGKDRIKNQYRLKGDIVYRQKTISSFIKDNPRGTYMVMVAKHALTIIDGEVYDWDGMKFKPSRKVQAAYEITRPKSKDIQLKLF